MTKPARTRSTQRAPSSDLAVDPLNDQPLPEMNLAAPIQEGAAMTIGDRPADQVPKQKKIALLMTDDGAVEFDRMKPETQAAILKAFRTPDMARRLQGAEGGAAATPARDEAFDRDLVGLLYDYAGSFLVRWARVKHTEESAAEMAFNDAEKARLIEPTIRVLEKYNISIGGRWKDEIVLLGVLGATIQQKAARLKPKPGTVVDFPRAAGQTADQPITQQ